MQQIEINFNENLRVYEIIIEFICKLDACTHTVHKLKLYSEIDELGWLLYER